ncbi:MAG TPA: DUF885 domain-containing protein [Vicinamibacterales bacterium]|nr:DUF885 domain-containing protein [Vicinamibacterales bacterium]
MPRLHLTGLSSHPETWRRSTIACLCAATLACGSQVAQPGAKPEPPDGRVKLFADSYLSAYFDRFPEVATQYGVPGRHHDKLTDNSLAAERAWEAREDRMLGELKAVDRSTIASGPLRATYAIALQALEGDVAKRICRDELWPVSQMTGWQVAYGYLVTIQPVGTDEARREALARWSSLPKYLDTEIDNLRAGIAQGYTSPKLNVRIVLDQVRSLAATPVKDSPFASPAQRDKSPEFQKAFTDLLVTGINPAMTRYADFLEREYLPAARDAIAVSANPNGVQCYDASVLYHSSVAKTAREVHELGLRQNAELGAEMKAIGERTFKTADVPTLLQRVRTDPKYKFKSREDKIAYSQAALARAKAAVPAWFGLLPKADVVIQPYPKFREKNAPNEYNPPAEDGSRPAVFFISAYQAEQQSRVEDESTAFHETVPGHHLQGAIALERKDIHPIGRYLFNSGYAEGWALYTERLADEMKLYSSDLDRLGMLSSQALRASRLVVDSGLHTLGWTRQQAIDYMLAHTAESRHDVESEVDRYIIFPGQATAYMIGRLEIGEARAEAEKAMGATFDIKAFHDRVLEDGGVPIAYLREKVRAWAAGK